MAKIKKVGPVVLGVRDAQRSFAFYTETLGMELVNDGNRLEIFCEMMEPEAGRKHMREGVNLSDRSYKPEPILSA